KNCEVPDAMLAQGFGYVEVGSLTPLPQLGNPRPRLFRLPEDEALINRLGFNNQGHKAALARLRRRAGRAGIVGVNIGAGRNSGDRIDDYLLGINAFNSFADYITINISSPNTSGLRELQDRNHLARLLARVMEVRERSRAEGERVAPLILKIAPDLSKIGLED